MPTGKKGRYITDFVCWLLGEFGWEYETEHYLGAGHRVDIFAKGKSCWDESEYWDDENLSDELLNERIEEVRNDRGEYSLSVEIKSSREDFRSGYGLNFTSEYNYLVTPEECAVYMCGAISVGMLPEKVGVIALTRDNRYLKVVRPALVDLDLKYQNRGLSKNTGGFIFDSYHKWDSDTPFSHLDTLEYPRMDTTIDDIREKQEQVYKAKGVWI